MQHPLDPIDEENPPKGTWFKNYRDEILSLVVSLLLMLAVLASIALVGHHKHKSPGSKAATAPGVVVQQIVVNAEPYVVVRYDSLRQDVVVRLSGDSAKTIGKGDTIRLELSRKSSYAK